MHHYVVFLFQKDVYDSKIIQFLLSVPLLELELHLRRCSRKIKVVPSLTGGAHILFPTAGTTLAVRVYDPFGIAKLEKEYSGLIQQSIRSRINIFAHQKDDATSGGNDRSVEIENDFDGICSFRNSFKHSVVFFALTNASLLSDQLSRFGSIVNSLQRCLAETCEFHTGCNNLEKVRLNDCECIYFRIFSCCLHTFFRKEMQESLWCKI